MKSKILILSILAIGVLWLWPFSPDEQDAPRHTETIEQDAPVPDKSEPVYTHQERPRLPLPITESRDSEPVGPVEFRRSPWDPKIESKEIYDLRMKLIEAFERFREETGVSDEKAQALLMLMNDFYETEKILDQEMESHRPYASDGQFEYWLRKNSNAWRWLLWDTHETLEDMLTPEENRIWWDTVERESPWIRMKWWPDSLVVPAEKS